MKEVLISGSRFKVVSYDVIPGRENFNLPNKKGMAYQFLVGYDRADYQSVRRYDTSGKSSIINQSAHLLAVEKTKVRNQPQQYEREDLNLILMCLSGAPMYFLELVEALVLATKDQPLIKMFYKTYGSENIINFKKECVQIVANNMWQPEVDIAAHYPCAYKKGRRYSIYRLVQDLVEDHAKILTDPDLIGAYERITASKKQRPEEVKVVEDQWQEIHSLVGNKTRANLSLQFTSYVDVTVPENDLGVKPGPRRNLECIKTFSLVKDGVLNMPLIAAKVSDKLAHKLRAVGCIKMKLIYKNSLLLDLSSIPVISKGDMKKFDSDDLGSAEMDLFVSNMAIDYLNLKKNQSYVRKTKSKKNISPQELFLRKLGIFDDKYYPQNEIGVREGRNYQTTELLTSIERVPSDSGQVFSAIRSYVKDGAIDKNCVKNAVNRTNLEWILANIDKLAWDLDKWKAFNKSANNKLRDMKFQIIMSKVANFYESKKPYVGKKKARVQLFEDPNRSVDVKWRFKDTNVNV